ncbi:MAG TPA: twin-arginine translocation signal domain-containing protein [Saccharospirillum sp.]|nr:twin-arginine translocation signal domain-containing protein [Saccharospirillum sp.]
MSEFKTNRRKFLKGSGTIGAGLAAPIIFS